MIPTTAELPTDLHQGPSPCPGKMLRDYFPALSFYAYSILKDMPESEDVVMDSLRKYWENRNKFMTAQPSKPFLYSCVRNRCIDILRRRKTMAALEKEWSMLHLTDRGNFLDTMALSELTDQLPNAIDSLPFACRRICHMLFYEGMNSGEVARALDVTVSTVKAQKQRALIKLKKKLLNYSI